MRVTPTGVGLTRYLITSPTFGDVCLMGCTVGVSPDGFPVSHDAAECS